jgi:hypothetical protein
MMALFRSLGKASGETLDTEITETDRFHANFL